MNLVAVARHQTAAHALRSALSDKASAGQIVVIDSFVELEGRTKAMLALLGTLGEARGTVIATGEKRENVYRAAANLGDVQTMLASNLNLHDLLKHARLILDREAIAYIEQTWGEESEERLRAVRRAA